jgi:pimeloyl-ACP methyl ester carboxylesterase
VQHDYVVEVAGATGTPILLLPGGASPSRGFFPGLDRLPGHRIVSFDRPGTGRAASTGQATLTTGADAAAAALHETNCAPAVVVGQSLGGPVAVQLAVDHPEVVSGLVLIDPTPFNDPTVCRQARRSFDALALPTRLPYVGARLDTAIWRLLASQTPVANDDEARAGLRVLTSVTLATTARAVRSLVADGAALANRLRPLGIPIVLVTADRKPGSRIRRAHEQLAQALGGRIETWPGAVHAEQLHRPEKIVELVRELAAEAAAAR